jgi:hypothetical protein
MLQRIAPRRRGIAHIGCLFPDLVLTGQLSLLALARFAPLRLYAPRVQP